jgi:hypothetical protein
VASKPVIVAAWIVMLETENLHNPSICFSGDRNAVSGSGARCGPYPMLTASGNSLKTSDEGHSSEVLHPP